MNIFTKFPLRIMTPLFLFLVGIIISAYSMSYSLRLSDSQVEKSAMISVTQDMSQLQGRVNSFLREGDDEGIKAAIAVRGSNPNVEIALLADENSIVLHATSMKLTDLPLKQAVPDIAPELVSQVKKTMSATVSLSKNRESIAACYPVVLGAREQELRPSLAGILYMKYDLRNLKAAGRYAIEQQMWQTLLFYGCLFLSLGVFLYYALTRRVLQVVNAAKRFAAGDLAVRSGLEGEDEIARIGGAFDSMAEKVAADQSALRESEERFRLLAENAMDVIYRMSLPDGRYEYVSPSSSAVFGYAPADFYDSPTLIQQIIHPDWQSYFEEQWTKLLAGNMLPYYEYQIIAKSGEARWMFQRNTLFRDSAGKPVAIEGIVTDISERKRAEEEIHLRNWIAQTFLTAVTEEELYGELLKVVLAAMKSSYGVVGYLDADSALVVPSMSGEVWDKCRVADKRTVFERDQWGDSSWPRAIREKKPNYSNQPSGITPAGHIAVDRHISMPVIFQEEVIGLIQIANSRSDYTDKDVQFLGLLANSIIAPLLNARLQRDRYNKARTLAEEEKSKLEDQLRQSQKMEAVGTLAGGIAHDFNNILTAIIGYGEMTLLKIPAGDPLRHNIECMLQGADRAARLTRELLLFSRKQAVDKKPVNLNEVVARVEKFLTKIIGEDIAYKTVIHEAPLAIMADEYQLEQVIMNLATNARDSMPKGGTLTVTTADITMNGEFVSAHGYGKPGDYALLTVADTGEGMNEETRQRIFEPFFTTKEVGKGTGLGLAVVYGIIKQHDGYINVYSEPGMGSTFRILLPIIAAPGGAEGLIKQLEPVAGGTETILLAEDDNPVRELTKNVLTEYGYTVIEAVDGADAVAKFIENSGDVDLLLLDMIMPKMNGKEALDEIQKTRPGIKAIFSSGYAPDIIRQKVSIGNGIQLIAKPVSPTELLKTVRSVLDEKDAIQQ